MLIALQRRRARWGERMEPPTPPLAFLQALAPVRIVSEGQPRKPSQGLFRVFVDRPSSELATLPKPAKPEPNRIDINRRGGSGREG